MSYVYASDLSKDKQSDEFLGKGFEELAKKAEEKGEEVVVGEFFKQAKLEIKLRELAYEEGLRGLNIDIFLVFIKERFPGEKDSGYLAEWANRIDQGSAWCAADHLSRKALVAAEVEVRNRYGGKLEASYKGGE